MPAASRSIQVLREATELPSPAAVSPLEAYRRRNAALDALFYDVRRVGDAEAHALSPWLVAEGAVLRVPPSGDGMLRAYPSVERFVADGGAACRALGVAGVGSSALGAAAFARNVADAVGGDVAAVVSGYGLSDVLSEGLGGWFWFGGINRWRRWMDAPSWAAPLLPVPAGPGPAVLLGRLLSRDLAVVIDLLDDPRLGFDLVVGHSKGNLVLSEALYEQVRRAGAAGRAVRAETLVVTMSAAITMPPVFRRVVDVMGELDWFGRLNSDPAIAIDVTVPAAWHHTNTETDGHLPVTEVLRRVLRERAAAADAARAAQPLPEPGGRPRIV